MARSACRTTTLPLLAWLAACASAQTRPATVHWSARDVTGQQVTVPAADRASIVAFVRPGQAQSDEALAEIARLARVEPGARVVLVIGADHTPPAGVAWPVVIDQRFTLAGQMRVHVWPTTVIVAPDGRELTHLAGLPGWYAVALEAHVAHALGKLDEAGLRNRLDQLTIVSDSDRQRAARHLAVARMMLDQGRPDAAGAEIDAGLRLQPNDLRLRALSARVLAATGHADEALAVVDTLPADAMPAVDRHLLRARLLVLLARWPEAKQAIADATAAATDAPATFEIHYLGGLVRQHDGDHHAAAEAFRSAYEATRAPAAPAATRP